MIFKINKNKHQEFIKYVNRVMKEHLISWIDIKYILHVRKPKDCNNKKLLFYERIEAAAKTFFVNEQIPKDLRAFRSFILELEDILDVNFPIDILQSKISILKNWFIRFLSLMLFLFISYIVIGGVLVGEPQLASKASPIFRALLLIFLLALLFLLEGSQISITKLSMKELDSYRNKYPRVHLLYKRFRIEEETRKYLAGRQLCVILIVFFTAQLTSFPDMQVWPFTNVSFPEWFFPWFNSIFLKYGVLGAIFVLWWGQLLPQFLANKNPIGFLNFWGTSFIVYISWLAESLGLTRPADWLSSWGKLGEDIPISSRDLYQDEISFRGYGVNGIKKIWRISKKQKMLHYQVSFIIAKSGITKINDDMLYLRGTPPSMSFRQQLVSSNPLILPKNLLVNNFCEDTLGEGWRQFVRDFQCNLGDFILNDVINSESEAVVLSHTGYKDNASVDMIKITKPTKFILFKIQFDDEPKRLGDVSIQAYNTAVQIPTTLFNNPHLLTPHRDESRRIFFEYFDLYPRINTCYMIQWDAEF